MRMTQALENIAWLDAALAGMNGKAPAPSNGRAQGRTQGEARRGSVASTQAKPLDAKGGAQCKGSYLLGTACKACFRCHQEKSMLLRNYRLGFQTHQEMLNLNFKPLELERELSK